nr:uncharacterized mitochondrial protein AtMg00810-like [Tanacetum cinerariifolium]GEX40647.1 uncharacterized mitochondrial protein AtMg00810-like [Tanacetum cinerariifolium]
MPTPSIESNTSDLQNSNSSVFEHEESSSSIMSKPMIKFVKAADSPEVIKTNKVETARNLSIKYAKMYRNTSKSPKVKEIENLKDLKVKIIRCDNEGGFKNKEMNEFCTKKGIKREFSNARTPQKNGVAERMNRTLIEAARTMLADAKLPRTKKVEENMRVDFLENKLIEKGVGPNWLIDIDTLTNSMNYVPVVVAGTSSTNLSGTKDVASQDVKKDVSSLRYIALPNCRTYNPTTTSKIPVAEQIESLTVEYEFPTVSSPVPTACLDTSPETSSGSRFISKEVLSQKETPSLDNALTLSNRFEDTIGVEANLSNIESSIPASPTPTFRIHKDHPKSQIIGPVDTPGKDGPGKDVELHLYRSMIGSLMYLTASRPDIMFAVCACARHQVTPKDYHPYAVKRIFRYPKGHPMLGLWYPKESPFDLVVYSDSDYGGATKDRKSTIGGCQFLGRRLISWQCKKQTIMATSTTKAEYVAAANDNVADLLTKPFDVGRFQYLVCEGSGTLTEPHHTPFPQEQHSSHHDTSSPSHPTTTTEPIPQPPSETLTETPTLKQYSRRATQIARSKALSTAADELASLLRNDSQGEAFPTVTSLDAGQDRENIIKTSALPHKSTPRVTSLDADEGSMQQQLQELMDLYTGLQRQQTQIAAKIKDQDLEISGLKARIKVLEDKDRGSVEPSGDDAPIKGRSMEIGEEVEVERSSELGSNDTEEMVNVLSSMEAANILTSRVTAVSVSPITRVSTFGVSTVTKDKGKEKVVESEEPKKKKLQEQIDAHVVREIEEEIAREDQRMNKQLARDVEIARIHAEEELKMLIDNEVIANHLQEYEQSEA